MRRIVIARSDLSRPGGIEWPFSERPDPPLTEPAGETLILISVAIRPPANVPPDFYVLLKKYRKNEKNSLEIHTYVLEAVEAEY